MKVVLEESCFIIYQLEGIGEYIMVDRIVNSVVCVFKKSNNVVYQFTPCSSYCFSNHDYYDELIEKIK